MFSQLKILNCVHFKWECEILALASNCSRSSINSISCATKLFKVVPPHILQCEKRRHGTQSGVLEGFPVKISKTMTEYMTMEPQYHCSKSENVLMIRMNEAPEWTISFSYMRRFSLPLVPLNNPSHTNSLLRVMLHPHHYYIGIILLNCDVCYSLNCKTETFQSF